MLHELLDRGFFPKELPPQFTTTHYAARLSGVTGQAPPIVKKPTSSLCADHDIPRGASLRRVLRLPNPVHFHELAKHVAEHWSELEELTNRSPYSLTRPVLGDVRALSAQHGLGTRVSHRARVRAQGRYLIRADITRFYSSIYTHTLPWAVIGKAEAKRRFEANTLKRHWADKLDRLVRKLNGNQTSGIPVGPDTSLVLAEVLLASVDTRVAGRYPTVKGIRYIDDYEFVTHTREDAEGVLVELQAALREIELELNGSKTTITELPLPLTEAWVANIRRHPIEVSRQFAQHEDLAGFFGLMFETMRQFPDEPVLRYGIGRLSRMRIQPANWNFYEHLLQQCVSVDASCLPLVIADIEYYLQQGYQLDAQWADLLNSVIRRQVLVANSNEAAWGMAFLVQFGLQLSDPAAKAVGESSDPVVALMGAMLAQRNLANWAPLEPLKRFTSSGYLYQPQWLVCYEAAVWRWFGSSPATFQDDAWFDHMYRLSPTHVTTFLRPNATVEPADKPDDDAGDDDDDDDLDLY